VHSCGAELGGRNKLAVRGFRWTDIEATREASFGIMPEDKALSNAFLMMVIYRTQIRVQ
jgi:hypothetical protein